MDKRIFGKLIPHSGEMCLLDFVEVWSDDEIRCVSISHTSGRHPLRLEGLLSSIHLVEYAAQAAAIHGALLAEREGKPLAPGFLAALRNCDLEADEIGTSSGPLSIVARKKLANAEGLIYEFSVQTASGELLGRGRLSVMLQQT